MLSCLNILILQDIYAHNFEPLSSSTDFTGITHLLKVRQLPKYLVKYESKFRSDKLKVAAAKATPHYSIKTVLLSFSKWFYLHTGAGGNNTLSVVVPLWLYSTATGKQKLVLLSNAKPEKEDKYD